jgi:hypothetical protein
MKKNLSRLFILLSLICLPSSGFAFVVYDQYIGGQPTNSYYNGQDVIGTPDLFDIDRMEVSFLNNQMTVDIYSNYFDNVGSYSTQMGDLFISTNGYNPVTPSTDDYGNSGEAWEYAIRLDNHTGSTHSGSAYLYNVLPDSIVYSFAPGYIYREGQEVQYTPQTTETSLLTGQWSISKDETFLRITTNWFDGLSHGSEIGLHWAMTCGNDVIEGKGIITPEPSTLLLFGLGIPGIICFRKKKKIA